VGGYVRLPMVEAVAPVEKATRTITAAHPRTDTLRSSVCETEFLS
jgi:hypothetical protein